MIPIEQLDEYKRYRAALAAKAAITLSGYEISSASIPCSGRAWSDEDFVAIGLVETCLEPPRHPHFQENVLMSNDTWKLEDTLHNDVATEGTDESFSRVVEYAIKYLSHKIADRLNQLKQRQLEEEDVALSAKSAWNLVSYVHQTNIKKLPLLTVTPGGELDATWLEDNDEEVTARFFENGDVWIAYRLSEHNKGSLQATLTEMLTESAPFTMPEWVYGKR